MKWIKRIFIIVTGLIAAIAIGLFTYKQIRMSKAKDSLIPAETKALIQVNVDGLVTELMGNALSNPNTYFFGDRDSTGRRRAKVWETGLNIPAMIFFFSEKADADQYYSVQEVKDLKRFKRFVKDQLHIDLDSNSSAVEGGYSYYQQKKLAILMNEKEIVFSIGRDSVDQSAKLKGLLQADRTTWLNALAWSKTHTEEQEADVLWSNADKNWFSFDFQNGSVHVDGLVKSDKWRFPDVARQLKPEPNAVLSAYLDADLSSWIQSQDSLLKKLDLPVDSVHKYYGGYVDINWLDKDVLQQESVISYEYDDNFEMKEVEQIQDVEAPNLLLRLKGSPHLLSYLPEKLFYTFQKSNQGDLLSLYTGEKGTEAATFAKAKLVFNFNYTQSATVIKHFGWLPKFDRWQKIQLEGKARDPHSLKLHGYFILGREKIHALYQLFED